MDKRDTERASLSGYHVHKMAVAASERERELTGEGGRGEFFSYPSGRVSRSSRRGPLVPALHFGRGEDGAIQGRVCQPKFSTPLSAHPLELPVRDPGPGCGRGLPGTSLKVEVKNEEAEEGGTRDGCADEADDDDDDVTLPSTPTWGDTNNHALARAPRSRDHDCRSNNALCHCEGSQVHVSPMTSSQTETGRCSPRGQTFEAFMETLWREQKLCDVILQVNGMELPAHKLALAAHSRRFISQYCQERPSNVCHVVLSETTVEAAQEVLRYVYTSQLSLGPQTVGPVLSLARQLDIQVLVDTCFQRLLASDFAPLLDRIHIAEDYGVPHIKDCLLSCLAATFTEVVKTPAFLACSLAELCRMLSDNALHVDQELEVFFAAVRWLEHDRPKRLPLAPQVLQHVRLVHVPVEDLAAHVEQHRHLFRDPDCQAQLLAAYRYHALKQTNSSLLCHLDIPPCRNRAQECPYYPPCLKLPCSQPLDAKAPCHPCPYPPLPVCKTSPHPPRAQTPPQGARCPCPGAGTLPPTSLRRRRLQATDESSSQQHVCSTSSTLASTSRVCPTHGEEKMNTRTFQHSHAYKRTVSPDGFSSASSAPLRILARAEEDRGCGRSPGALQGVRQGCWLLALGGVDPFNTCVEVPARLVQQYSPRVNAWSALTRLPDARHHHGVALLDGYVYVVGGSILDCADPGNLANPTAVCYRYSCQENCWARLASLTRRRAYHGLAELGGLLYAVGGQDQKGETLDSVEYYNPDTDAWLEVSAMTEPKIGCATVGFRGYLYVIGGYVETADEKTILGTVECYDPHTNTWFSRRHLPGPRCHAAVVEAGGRLYLAGGATFFDDSDAVTSLTSVLAYSELDDRWTHFLSLRTPRHDFGSAAIGSQIYIVGGVCSAQNRALCDVECIDVAAVEWLDHVECLGNQALGIACCVVPCNE